MEMQMDRAQSQSSSPITKNNRAVVVSMATTYQWHSACNDPMLPYEECTLTLTDGTAVLYSLSSSAISTRGKEGVVRDTLVLLMTLKNLDSSGSSLGTISTVKGNNISIYKSSTVSRCSVSIQQI